MAHHTTHRGAGYQPLPPPLRSPSLAPPLVMGRYRYLTPLSGTFLQAGKDVVLKTVLGVCLHLPIIFPPQPPLVICPPPPPPTHTHTLQWRWCKLNMLLGQCHVPRCFSCFDLLVMKVFEHLVLRFIKATTDHQLDLHQLAYWTNRAIVDAVYVAFGLRCILQHLAHEPWCCFWISVQLSAWSSHGSWLAYWSTWVSYWFTWVSHWSTWVSCGSVIHMGAILIHMGVVLIHMDVALIRVSVVLSTWVLYWSTWVSYWSTWLWKGIWACGFSTSSKPGHSQWELKSRIQNEVTLNIGYPQGCVLSHLLFSLFINPRMFS